MNDVDATDPSTDSATLPSLTGPSAGIAGTREAGARRTALMPGDHAGDWIIGGHLGTGSAGDVYVARGLLESLAEYLSGAGMSPAARMPVPAVCRGAAQIGEALAYLHHSGKPDGSGTVVRNDVTPENILQVDGMWVLADLGTASPAGRGGANARAGSLSYLAPEYLAEPPEDKHPPGDIWAFGIVLHRWLAGCHPFPGDNPAARARALRAGEPPVLAIPDPGLSDLVGSMLARDPLKRPDARAVTRALRSAAGPEPRRKRGPCRTVPRLTIAAAAALAGAAAGAGLYAWLAPSTGQGLTSIPSYGVVKSLTPGRAVPVLSRPDGGNARTMMLPDGTPLPIMCTTHGAEVAGNWGRTDLWDKIIYSHATGWVSDGLLYTAGDRRGGPVVCQ